MIFSLFSVTSSDIVCVPLILPAKIYPLSFVDIIFLATKFNFGYSSTLLTNPFSSNCNNAVLFFITISLPLLISFCGIITPPLILKNLAKTTYLLSATLLIL